MKQRFIIKMQGKQLEKERVRIYVIILCIIFTMLAFILYSSRYAYALIVPIFWLLYRLKAISSERKYMTDVICEVEVLPNGMLVTLNSAQSQLCRTFLIDYNRVRNVQIDNNCKVTICFIADRSKETNWEFYPAQDSIDFWKMELAEFV